VNVDTTHRLLQTERACFEATLRNNLVTDMPLKIQGGRTLSSFMFAYMPGVEGSDYSSHINGSPVMSKEVMIGDTSAISKLGEYLSESGPPVEAVDQFQVETAGIRAADGCTYVGVFRCDMKSATNSIHGAVFGFLENAEFDRNSWFNKYQYGNVVAANPARHSGNSMRVFSRTYPPEASASVDRFCRMNSSLCGAFGRLSLFISLRKG
jgi:hypothetical protein